MTCAQDSDMIHISVPWSPAISFLQKAGATYSPLEYEYRPHGGTHDAAAQLGLPEHAVVKTLVFHGFAEPFRPLLALMHGDLRVSVRRLERLSNERRLLPARPDFAREVTGYLPGGISPFGTRRPLEVFVQQTLRNLDLLYINAGWRGLVVGISPAILQSLAPVYGDFASATN